MAFIKCASCGQLYTSKLKLQEHEQTRHLQQNPVKKMLQEEADAVGKRDVAHRRIHAKAECHFANMSYPCFACPRSYPLTHMPFHVVRNHLAELKQYTANAMLAFKLPVKDEPYPSQVEEDIAYLLGDVPEPTKPLFKCPCCHHELDIRYLRVKKQHINRHIREFSGAYKCSWCCRVSTGRAAFRAHSRKPHCIRCCDCELSFSRTSHLVAHRREAHGEVKRLPCRHEGCGASFLFRYQLAEHQRTHRVPCRLCSRVFDSQAQADVHLRRVHAKNGVLTCYLCRATFETAEELVAHRRTHYMFDCPKSGCNFRAISQRVIERHKKTHLETKPFCCFRCQRTFSFSHSYLHHLRRVHGVSKVLRRGPKANAGAAPCSCCCVKDEPL